MKQAPPFWNILWLLTWETLVAVRQSNQLLEGMVGIMVQYTFIWVNVKTSPKEKLGRVFLHNYKLPVFSRYERIVSGILDASKELLRRMTIIGFVFCPTEDAENRQEKAQNMILLLKLIRVTQSNPKWEGRIRKGTPNFSTGSL